MSVLREIDPSDLQPNSQIRHYLARVGTPEDHAECLRIRNFYSEPVPVEDFLECLKLRERMSSCTLELALLLHPDTAEICAFAYYVKAGKSVYFLEEAVHPDLNEAPMVKQCLGLAIAFAAKIGAEKIVFYMDIKNHFPSAYLRKLGFEMIRAENAVNKAMYQPSHGRALFVSRLPDATGAGEWAGRGETSRKHLLTAPVASKDFTTED